MRVALYARGSSESQEARGTIGSQLEVLRARIVAGTVAAIILAVAGLGVTVKLSHAARTLLVN